MLKVSYSTALVIVWNGPVTPEICKNHIVKLGQETFVFLKCLKKIEFGYKTIPPDDTIAHMGLSHSKFTALNNRVY